MTQLVDYAAMAKELGIAKGTLYSWVSLKRIPHIRFGPRCVRFDPVVVRRWVASHKSNRDSQEECTSHFDITEVIKGEVYDEQK